MPLLRAQGEPHVRPRLVRGADRGAVLAALPAARGARHCGLAEREGGAAAVFVDALAELAPLKTQARTGEWLELTATLHVPLSAAQVVVLGPSGRPRTVPTQVHGDRVRARFALDRPGAFTVQLVGTLPAGPEPMLEAWVFADVAPSPQRDPAPGEEAGNDAEALARMVATLRREERLPPLRRKPELDALARAHAEKMRKRRGIAHDAGDGDLVLRFTEAGLTAHSIGENVARARTAALAHRILYASPSHRLNLLSTEFTELGVGTASDEAGTVYACEVFARP